MIKISYFYLIIGILITNSCKNIHPEIAGKYIGQIKQNDKSIILTLKKSGRFEYDMGTMPCSRMRTRFKGHWHYSDQQLYLYIDHHFKDTLYFLKDTGSRISFRRDSFSFIKIK